MSRYTLPFGLMALFTPALAVASTPALTFGGALDPVSGSIAAGLGGLALWHAHRRKAASQS